ncbi:MAG: helix-turn-helix domain-containing protein [Rhodothermaceae bacterium]|nr:helix-turn-helix domain-containing protein [Rhodothermaceae bacterium]
MSTMHEDLKAIRDNQKMSIQDVYEKTRISAENIRLIESGELYTRPDANKIYLRSYTRTYAKAVGVSDEDITTALDYMEADMYEGFLAEKYLGSKPEPVSPKVPPKPPFPKNPASDKPAGEKTDDDRDVNAEKRSDGPLFNTSDSGDDDDASEPDPPRAENKKIRRTSTRTTSIFAPAIPGREPLTPTDDPTNSSVDWADVNKKIVSSKDGNGPLIFLGLLGIVLVAALIYVLSTANGDESDSGVATVPGPRLEQTLASDTLGAPVSPDPAQLAAALPDTLILTVYAARGNLEPVRILTDLFNIQRPYWVEAGRAMQFEFLQDIQIRGNLERMILMYDDRIITDFQQYDAENRVIIISREQFLRDPTMSSFSTDVMPDNLPRPVEILERPRM